MKLDPFKQKIVSCPPLNQAPLGNEKFISPTPLTKISVTTNNVYNTKACTKSLALLKHH